jgi:hypothetical protein
MPDDRTEAGSNPQGGDGAARAVDTSATRPAGQLLRTISLTAVSPRPFDVAVVVPTIGRPSLRRAVESVYAQQFEGTVQLLLGVDAWQGPAGALDDLARSAPARCTVAVFDPGYSTSVRHGGLHPARDGGALRTILSYAAHSRLVAYLDDDNWWAPVHLATLAAAVAGHDWAYSLRWYADGDAGEPLCVDRWESVGPDAGVFKERFGGFVDPSCLLVDKLACEPALRRWSTPLQGDASGMSADRLVFEWLRQHGRGATTGQATAYYALGPSDGMHPQRLRWIAEARSRDAA